MKQSKRQIRAARKAKAMRLQRWQKGCAMMPAIAKHAPRSKRGANRQYSAILRAYKTVYAGGGAFGWDWPTLRYNWPEGYAKLQALKSTYYGLPS